MTEHAHDNRILVKLRPADAAGAHRSLLRPLFAPADVEADAGAPRWYAATLPDGADTAWDLAHTRVAEQLGVREPDVLFVEPDLVQRFVPGDEGGAAGKEPAPAVAWHLDDDHTQLAAARGEVAFTEPRTRIAHADTGFHPAHATVPGRLRADLGWNFAEDRLGDPGPDGAGLFDDSGHGTGTLALLAGGGAGALGGAPDAEVVPLRIGERLGAWRSGALARAIDHAARQRCDVLLLGVGGLPSRAWEEAVDRAYEAGLVICAAAGDHRGGAAPAAVVYPAHYARVIAVCGVTADDSPYADPTGTALEGCRGPASAMRGAMAAYVRGIPWAVYRSRDGLRPGGEGTSAAAAQVAAAAALWLEQHKRELPRDWQRVEAVRHALFQSARKGDETRVGSGVLRARAALGIGPSFAAASAAASTAAWPFLRPLTGVESVRSPGREAMFNLEVAQRWMLDPRLREVIPDPGATPPGRDRLVELMEALIGDVDASRVLRRHLAARYPAIAGRSFPGGLAAPGIASPPAAEGAPLAPADPPYRRIRVFAVDPSLSTRLDTADTNVVALRIRWERPSPGPAGEYLEVRDEDEAGAPGPAVNLDDPRLLAVDGWAPSEGNPQFRQQMVYAVAMKTIEHFERAMGRPVLWRAGPGPDDDGVFMPRLTVRPTAMQQANAHYTAKKWALNFGWFQAEPEACGDQMPGGVVYTCLSHDVIAHETAHAVLDGMHRRFTEASNPDVLALHEGFADIVALMQHFTIPEVLEREIRRTRGDLEAESVLGAFAVQLGQASGGKSALRQAIGTLEDGVWRRRTPDRGELRRAATPHARGAVLVAAVFDAFLAIYRARTADLLRIAAGAPGVLPDGGIHPDLVRRLAEEAARSAGHVLTMCIRALDYLPPVDVTFFEYLRALITADFDLVPEDRYDYRVAFVEAFRRRGIYPLALGEDTPRTMSVATLRWDGSPVRTARTGYTGVIRQLKRYARSSLYERGRGRLFENTRLARRRLRTELGAAFAADPAFAQELGIDPARGFEVDSLYCAVRAGPDGRVAPQAVLSLAQGAELVVDAESFTFWSGSTLVVDLLVPEVKYRIVKNVDSQDRRARTAAFHREVAADPLRELLTGADDNEPFEILHALAADLG
jgi:hypothetical protein